MAKLDILKRLTTVTPQPVEDAKPAQGDTAGLPNAANDTTKPTRIGLWVLVAGLGGFLLWAAFAPLDEGVPSQGHVAIDTKRKAVQHLQGGIVKEVLVGEGTKVTEGQVLIRLDEATPRAQFESTRQRYLGFRAIQGRLQAEQVGAASITWHPDLVQAAAQDPLIRTQMSTQEQLFRSRRASLAADMQAFNESIQGQQALIQSYGSMVASRRASLNLITEELNNTRGLVKDGYAPRNRQLELERMVAEANSSLAELQGNTMRSHAAIAEMRQKSIARQQEYRKEVETQLADVTREVESEEGKFTALRNDLQRVEIRSPATGQVVGLAVQTVGGVISPGQKLMDIVPENETLLLETRVPPNYVDSVKAGLPVDVRFHSFAHSPQLVVEGKVVSVSGDLLTDQQSGQTYYLARIALTPEAYTKLGKRQLQPGMPVEVVLKTGERSMLSYLLHPLTKRIASAMKEE